MLLFLDIGQRSNSEVVLISFYTSAHMHMHHFSYLWWSTGRYNIGEETVIGWAQHLFLSEVLQNLNFYSCLWLTQASLPGKYWLFHIITPLLTFFPAERILNCIYYYKTGLVWVLDEKSSISRISLQAQQLATILNSFVTLELETAKSKAF